VIVQAAEDPDPRWVERRSRSTPGPFWRERPGDVGQAVFMPAENEKTPRRSGVSCPLCRHRRTAGAHADAIAGFQPRLRPGASGSPLSCAARRRACEERLGPRPFARHARGGRRTAPFGRTGRADTALARDDRAATAAAATDAAGRAVGAATGATAFAIAGAAGTAAAAIRPSSSPLREAWGPCGIDI
jgi:hypothetical protein